MSTSRRFLAAIALGVTGVIAIASPQPAGTSPARSAPQPATQVPAAPVPTLIQAQPSATPPLPGGMAEDLAAKLTALRPSEPDAYLRLGEDVAARAIDSRGRELARQLFTLAFALDRKRSGGAVAPTATSACLALAEISATESDRRWLLSLARSIDLRLSAPSWSSRGAEAADSGTAYLAAVYVGLVRGGDSIRAQRVIAQPGVRDLIQRYERLLSPINDTGGLNSLEQEMTRWPCPECSGKRIVRRFQSNPPQYRLCSVCGGTLGPALHPQELAAQLRFESRMLSGTARSWAAQVIADGGVPLRDVDPAELPAAMGVDPSAVLWRDGRWISDRPASPLPPPAPATEQPPTESSPPP